MKLPLDPGDILGDGCWETVKRVLAPASSLWAGCFCALASIFLAEIIGTTIAGNWGDIPGLFIQMAWSMLFAPFALLLSVWSLIVVPMLGLAFYMMLRGDREVLGLWLVCTVGVALMVMASDAMALLDLGSEPVAWIMFTLITVSLGAASFFFRGWQKNVHAQHLLEVSAENELRRLQMEQRFGTKSFGQGENTRE